MFLEYWQIGIIFVAFGACAWFSTRSGFNAGINIILNGLIADRVIEFNGTKFVPFRGTRVRKKGINT